MTVHHSVTMSPDSAIPKVEQETKGEAEYVSRKHPMYGSGFGPEETVYPFMKRMSEPYRFPKSEINRTTKLHKKAKAKLLGAS